MRILFVCHRLPYPANRGGKIRPFNMIRHLSRNHSVTVASLAESEQELSEASGLRDHCTEVIAEVLPLSARRLQAAQALLTMRPSSVAYFRSPTLSQRIHVAATDTRFDLALVHCAFVAGYALGVRCGVRILDFGDLDSSKWFDYSRHRAFPLSLGYALEAKKLRSYERYLAQQSDYCTLTTEGEALEFRKLHVGVPFTVIPNGVDTAYFGQRPLAHDSASIVFLGRMDYFPNVQGVSDFVQKVFPLIRQSVPTAEFRIVGSNPTRAVQALARVPGVSVTGHVADVRHAVRDAAVSVAPLKIARGTQNKILESMAMGIPVVATAAAARGIRATPEEHLLVADEPAEFARRVIELIVCEPLRQKLGEAARQQVLQAHAWPRSMNLLETLIEDLAARTASSSRSR
jgi:sugar transferase (PEP-CTERM/EpsH1 system associated)